MGLIPLEQRNTFTYSPELPTFPTEFDPQPVQEVKPEDQQPEDPQGFGLSLTTSTGRVVPLRDVTDAAFRKSGTIGSFLSDQSYDYNRIVDPNFDLYSHIAGTDYEKDIDHFLDIHNIHDFELMKKQLDQQRRDRKLLAESGWVGFGLELGAAILGPENLIPGALAYRVGKAGYSVGKSALRIGAASGVSAGIAESVLQSTQLERPWEETVAAIGGSTVLGFLLGGALAKLANRGIVNNISKQIEMAAKFDKDLRVGARDGTLDASEELYDRVARVLSENKARIDAGDIPDVEVTFGRPGSVGAAAHMPTLDELSVYGKAASVVAEKTQWLNPILRLLHSNSASARNVAQNLFEQPIYLKMNEYRASAIAVESVVKRYTDGILPDIIERVGTARRMTQGGSESLYAQMKRAGINMTREDYNEDIGRALRHGDEGSNEYVTKAAKVFRDEFFEPMRQELERLGFDVPEAGKSTTSETYLPRMWNIPKLIAGEGNFKQITTDWLRGQISEQVEREMSKVFRRMENLQREIDELKMASDRRKSELRERFGEPSDQEFAEIAQLENDLALIDEALEGIAEGKPIIDTLRRMPPRLKEALGDVERVLDTDLSDEVRDLATRILPRNISVKLAKHIDETTGRLSVDTPAFKKWFGKSKVVDDEGKPAVMYHGTRADFDEFDPVSSRNSLGSHFGTRDAANEIFTMSEIEKRKGVSYPDKVYPVYLKVENPLRMEDMHHWLPEEVAGRLEYMNATENLGIGKIPKRSYLGSEFYDNRDISKALKDAGYDGIVYTNKFEDKGSDSYIVFDANQVKSATSNIGTFDPADPRIRFSMAQLETTETPAFKNWFQDSKVVDEAGDPLTVFHGGASDIEQFDLGFLGRGTNEFTEGVGFYFTDKRSLAQQYAAHERMGESRELYDVYLRIRKPMTITQREFTDSDVEKIIDYLIDRHGEEDILSNYGDYSFEGVDVVKKRMIDSLSGNETDIDLISDIGGAGVNRQSVNDAVVDITGYDGVIHKGHFQSVDPDFMTYVVFQPNQIKSVQNIGEFDLGDPRIRYSLPGFESASIKTVRDFKQEKASPQQWKALLDKASGVKKDELDWMGVKEWLDEQGKSVTKADLLNFMDAHSVKLDEKVLGGDRILKPTKIDAESNVTDFEKELGYLVAHQYEIDGVKYRLLYSDEKGRFELYEHSPIHSEEQFYSGPGNILESGVENLAQAEHQIIGYHLDVYGRGVEEAKFSSYKIPGGDNYKELLVRLPELEGQFKSPHFQDQEIVHIRFDERNVDGKRVLFINEIQSDLHQAGRRKGYLSEDEATHLSLLEKDYKTVVKEGQKLRAEEQGIKKSVTAKLSQHTKELPITGTDVRHIFEVLGGARKSLPDTAPEELSEILDLYKDDLDVLKMRNINERIRKQEAHQRRIDNEISLLRSKTPQAPFKGDLWLELALKRMIKYANDNEFDSISWARSDQIAEAVGGDAQALSVQYDQKIGRFLSKYTKKFGGRVERVADDSLGLERELDEKSLVETLPEIDRINYEVNNIDGGSYQKTIDRIEEYASLGAKLNEKGRKSLEYAKSQIEKGIEKAPPLLNKLSNPILHLTPKLKKISTQFLNIRDNKAQGSFNPAEALITLSRDAIDPAQTLRHESVHALRGLGLFTDAEWATLTKSAEKLDWAKKHNVRERYESVYGGRPDVKDLDEFLIEEAIADEFMLWKEGRTTVTKALEKIFQKIRKFLETLGHNLEKEGIKTFEDVFKKIETGEVGARAVDEDVLTRVRDEVQGRLEEVETRLDTSPDVSIKEDDVIDMLRVLQEGPPEAPQRLMQFIRSKGGLVDPDGNLKAMGIAQGQKGVPPGFIKKLTRSDFDPKGGMALDDAARVAWEDGFFPGQERPTIDDFLEALREDFDNFRPVVRGEDIEAAQALEDFRVLEETLARMGYDAGSRPRLETLPEQASLVRSLSRAQDELGAKRIQKLEGKRAKLQETYDEMEYQADEFIQEQMIEDVVNGIYDKLTGNADIADDIRLPEDMAGPFASLKHKTFRIPDKLIEFFLEDNIEPIALRYARKVGAQIEMKRKFGSLDLKDHLEKIKEEYILIRRAVEKNQTLTQDQKITELKRLHAEEKGVLRDIRFGRDKLLGNYKWDIETSPWTRSVDAALTFNYVRAMGGVTLTSAPDIFHTVAVHGFRHVFGTRGLLGLIAGSKGIKMNRRLAKKLAGIAEITHNSRAAMNMDLADPYAVGTPFERFMQNMSKQFSTLTGMTYWNQYLKEFTGHLTIDRVIGNALNKNISDAEIRYMNMLGFNEDMVRAIRQARKDGHIEKVGGVWTIDDTTALGEEMTRNIFAAVSKDISSTIVTRGVGDIPILMNHPAGKMIGQFKSFAIASHQRVLLRGLQEDQSKFLVGALGMITTGMFVYALKQLESGREISDNPGTILAEGIDRSGLFTLFFEANNMFEKNGGPGVYSMLSALFPDQSQRAPASRYAIRSQAGAVLGPSFGAATDILSLMSVGSKAVNPFNDKPIDITPGQVKSARRLTPFASLPYWRWYIDGHVVPHFQDEVR